MWIIIYLYLFAFSFILSLILIPVLRKFAVKSKILDAPSERKVHLSPKPLLGGLALYFSFIITVFFNLFLLKVVLNSPGVLSFIPQIAVDRLPSFQKELSQIKPLAIGSTLIVFVGLVDDIKGMNPGIKILCSALIAVIMVLLGVKISFFIPHHFWSGVLTVIWFVLIMNSFNLLDNMDGLACGVALIAAFIFGGITALQSQLFTSSMLIIFVGVLAGFLIFNWYPSSIFMGDTGSMWLGFMMANLTVVATFYSEGNPTLFSVIMPLLILGVPIFDTISVMFIRLVRKKSFFIGDKNHFSHRLVQLGMTQPQAVAFIYLITFCIGINATLLSTVGKLGAMVILLQAVVIFVIIALLEYTGRKSVDKSNPHL